MPAAESESVVVPEVQFSLQDTAFQQLPLQQRDSYGMDIDTSVKVFISSLKFFLFVQLALILVCNIEVCMYCKSSHTSL